MPEPAVALAGAGAPGDAVIARVRALAAHMRAAGSRVGVGEVLTAHRALAAVDAPSRADAFHALRPALCSSCEDLERYRDAFLAVFAVADQPGPLDELGEIARAALPRAGMPGTPKATPPAAERPEPVPAAWSAEELLRAKDFAAYTEAEMRAAHRLLARLAARGPLRRSRRTRSTRRRREVHDLRASLRASVRHGGELLERRWREPTLRPRKLVLVCDVSGSMSPYARMLLQYLQAAVTARSRVEAFAFATKLTRLTRELEGRDPDRALARAADVVVDVAGGTRIGDAISELNREHGRRIGRAAMIVILSDGWDRGDPDLLSAELARLRRCAHRLVWLNPLAADARYAPLTRGMQAALPHVDHLLPGNSIQSLEALAALMEEAG
jgi:hypothetical protein